MLKKILEEAYKDNQFVRIRKTPVDLKSTAGTNFCDILLQKWKSTIYQLFNW